MGAEIAALLQNRPPIWRVSPRFDPLHQRGRIIEQLMDGQWVDMPPDFGTFKQAPKAKKAEGEQKGLGI